MIILGMTGILMIGFMVTTANKLGYDGLLFSLGVSAITGIVAGIVAYKRGRGVERKR